MLAPSRGSDSRKGDKWSQRAIRSGPSARDMVPTAHLREPTAHLTGSQATRVRIARRVANQRHSTAIARPKTRVAVRTVVARTTAPRAGVGGAGAGRALPVGVDVAHVAQPVADGPGRCRVLVPLVGGTSRHRRSLAASRPVVPEPLYDSAGLRVSRRATIPGPRPRARPPGCPRRYTPRRRSRPPPRAASSRSRTSRRW